MQSLPHTQELAAKYKDQGVVVLAVCTSDTRAKFEEWVKKNQEKYPGILFTHDPAEKGPERASAKLYEVPGIPAQFVIGRDGKLAGRIIGFDGAEDARSEAALAKAGVKVEAAIVAKGDEQSKKEAEEEAARAAEEAANPPPTFRPQLGERKSGDVLPDFTLVGPDGKEFAISKLRGKTVVVGVGFEDLVPSDPLQAVGTKHGANGVVPLAMMIYSKRADYDAWLEKNKSKANMLSGWDPAGGYEGDREKLDMKAYEAWDAKTALRKILGGGLMNGTPGFPFFFVVDPAGKFVGMFWAGKNFDEGLGNLLLRAGVKLAPADMPKKLAKDEDFVVQPPPPPEAPVEQIAIGAVAPDFAMTDAAGKPVKLSDFKGKVVVLDFWATWCGPCVASMPHTQEVAAHYKDQGVVVLGSCTSDKRKAFEAWVAKNQSKYPDFVYAHDPLEKSPERPSHKLYGVSGIPAQFIIGRDGKIAAFVSGYMQGEVLLEAALAKAGVKVAPEILAKAAADQKKRDER
jgi:peroxiredoxin